MDNKKIGALWKKTSKSGTEFMSGVIEVDEKKVSVVVFKNKKEKDNQPDWTIFVSQPLGEKPASLKEPYEERQAPTQQAEEIRLEDTIPF